MLISFIFDVVDPATRPAYAMHTGTASTKLIFIFYFFGGGVLNVASVLLRAQVGT